MRASTLAVVLSAALLIHARGSAADLHYTSGKVLEGVRILSAEETNLVVLHKGEVFTVHATDLTAKSAAALGIRPPTEAEVQARLAAEAAQQARAAEQMRKLDELDRQAIEAQHAAKVAAEAEARARPPAPVRVIYESDSRPGLPTQARFQGSIQSRVAGGAIARGDGAPRDMRNRPSSAFAYWITGSIFIRDDGRLVATTRGTPFSADLIADGEYRYTDSAGNIRVLRAWRVR
ncbi:hypothetical protein ASA1KI_20930 [Opitutales bacterium ASA1]|uniref:hypothetical protein n=1 Tax=Congregicoccus parvus TaxID=3081749 RepID=UPI002B2FF6E8|nr:hypothetical protein ASA1KI_20930 [Opitutales bacterium ASA1]